MSSGSSPLTETEVKTSAPACHAPRVGLVSGFWGQNIGNAYFNVGGKWILEQVFPDRRVEFIQDQPGYRTFHNQRKGNPKNDLLLLKYLDVDYLVLQGPMFTTTFEALWGETFAELTRRGVKIILLSAGFFRYTEAEISATRAFLKRFPPAIISTRDHQTFENIKDLCPLVYSGIDSAFFVPKAYQPFKLTLPPYITVNFDQFPEPTIAVSREPERPVGKFAAEFDFLGHNWGLTQPALQMRFARAGQWQTYLGALIDFRKLPTDIGGFKVVRTDHRFNPHITWKVYQQPNSVASDEPFTYFTVYAGTQLTLSDRVHACVATLAYGRPAMLFTPTPRARLFERLDLGHIRRQPVTLDAERLESERQKELKFLSEAVQSLR